MPKDGRQALLDFMPEPIFVLDLAACVRAANAAAYRLIGTDPIGRKLDEFIAFPTDPFRDLLRRASGLSSPLLGALRFVDASGQPTKRRVYAARLRSATDQVEIALRCDPDRDDQFKILTDRIHKSNVEIGRQRRAQAALEETLRNNQLLMRELNHRVKNNIQLMLSLFSAAKRDANSAEVRAFIDDSMQRLTAIGTAHQLMYQSEQVGTVSAKAFIGLLAQAIGESFPPGVEVECSADEVELSNDVVHPLAMIISELMTNAAKHGIPDGKGKVHICFQREGGDCVLMIQDEGRGIKDGISEHRSSGLGLVRGLCRQIGGSFALENANGTRAIVRFSSQVL